MSESNVPRSAPMGPGQICRACGGEIAAGSRYCGLCGAPQSSAVQVSPVTAGRAGHEVFCRACGRPINAAAPLCPGCGAPQGHAGNLGEVGDKSRVTAGLLALLLG